MRQRLKALNEAVQEALDEQEDDVQAVVVTKDGWAIVSTEGSRQHALKMLDCVSFEEDKSGGQQ